MCGRISICFYIQSLDSIQNHEQVIEDVDLKLERIVTTRSHANRDLSVSLNNKGINDALTRFCGHAFIAFLLV